VSFCVYKWVFETELGSANNTYITIGISIKANS
jgi:hypothetical protein